MSSLWVWGIDYQNQPLLDPYWTPGWTSQNDSYVQVPPNQFSAPGFPSGLSYVTVTGNYYDSMADPLSGYLTFWPSSPLTITANSNVTYIPQRYSGINQTLLGINQMGDGKIYLWQGQLSVSLLATDNANMAPVSFTYHVRENYIGGIQYDIVVPSADVSSGADIHNLIIPGSIRPVTQEDSGQDEGAHIYLPVTASQYIVADITTMAGGAVINPTTSQVNFAFIAGPTQPVSDQWIAGQWVTSAPPYVAQILVGQNGYALSQGTYKIWVQVSASPQNLVIPVGTVTVY